MGIDKARTYFSNHTGDEEKVLNLINSSFNELDKQKKFCYIGKPNQRVEYASLFKQAVFPENYSSEKEVMKHILKHYVKVVNVAHPLTQVNVNPPPTNVAIAASALSAKYNENSIWDFLGQSSAISEVMAIGMMADLIGYSKKNAGGVFTFGGTASNLYGGKIGLAKVLPEVHEKGLHGEKVVFICSELAHYSIKSVAIWLGLGTDHIISIPTNKRNEMDVKVLEKTLRDLKKKRTKVACIFATVGTTDAFGVDPVEKIHKVCKKLKVNTHIHADAVIGWVFLTFAGFNFSLLKEKDRKLAQDLEDTYNYVKQIKYADSVGIDFHKTGWTNYITSCFVIKDRKDFVLLRRDKQTTPYLFHGYGYKPGQYTLETSRPNYAQRAMANMLAFGKKGYQDLVIHLYNMRTYFEKRCEQENVFVLNRDNHFFVTDLRLYPWKVSKDYFKKEMNEQVPLEKINEVNDYNKKIIQEMEKRSHRQEAALFSLSKNYKSTTKGHAICCIKSFPMSPFTEKKDMEKAVQDLLNARRFVTNL